MEKKCGSKKNNIKLMNKQLIKTIITHASVSLIIQK